MRNVSSEFRRQMETDRSFRYSAVVTLANNTTFTLTEDDLVSGGCGLTCSPGSSSFPVGNAICQKLDLSFYNADDQYANTDFFGAVIHPKLEFDLEESGTTETIWFEYYTVTEPETYGSTIEVSAYDAFYKADKPFNQATTFPLTAGTLLQDCCTACGLSCQSARFPNDDFVINTAPEEGTTYRQVIGLIAMLAGGNAVIRNGAVTIVPYNMSWFDDHAGYDGGVFDSASPYRSGDSVSGGSFNPWVVGDENGDTFSDWNSVHYFFETASPTLATDDVVITGVEVRGSEDESYLSGTEGYVLTMENVLCTGSEQDAATRIGNLLIGMRFRPFNVDLYSYPLAEIGDNCMICDIRGRYYQSVVTDVTFAFGGYTKVACSADSPVRNSSSYFASTADVKARQIARKISETTVSAYDREVQRMVSLMANSMGMFETVQEQQDGSRITIMHDKPTIGASTKLWKHTADAFMVSNDGGQTWVSGFDVSGNAVLNVLSAIGINFDWARGGSIRITKPGNIETFYANSDTGVVRINADTFSLSDGSTINSIAQSAASSAVSTYDTSLNQTAVFNKLTNNGAAQGIYMQNGQLYINFEYAKGGRLTLGGSNNNNGWMRIFDSNGTQIGKWDKDGLSGSGTFTMTHVMADPLSTSSITRTLKFGTFSLYVPHPEDYGLIDSDPSWSSESMGGLSLLDSRYNKLYFGTHRDIIMVDGLTEETEEVNINYIYSKGILYIKADTKSVTQSKYYLQLEGGAIVLMGTRTNLMMDYNKLEIRHNARINIKSATTYLTGNFSVSGTKNRLVSTENYDKRLLYSYETPSPMFGDVGEGVIADDGYCYITIDPIFAETINTNHYQVFLQAYGEGICYINERKGDHFVVRGTPGLYFGWEIKAKQADFDQKRLNIETLESMDMPEETDYGEEAAEHIEELRREREGT